MAKKYRVPEELRNDYRRLVQLANRRIRTVEKQYREAGKTILPSEVVGKGQQMRKFWHTEKTPIDRKVIFDSEKDFREKMRFLKSFDPKEPGYTRPTATQYTEIQREKTIDAMQTSFGMDVPMNIIDEINKLNSAELSEFWRVFGLKASKLGMRYSSEQAMQDTLNELFPEDAEQFEGIANNIRGRRAG